MFITIKTIISFDPLKEYDAMMRFIHQHDMTEWGKSDSTCNTIFMKTEHYKMEGEE